MVTTTKENPELIFCLAGPLGVDIDKVIQTIEEKLTLFNYRSESIRLTDILPIVDPLYKPPFPSLEEGYRERIASANRLCDAFGNHFMSLAGLFFVQSRRAKYSKDPQVAAEGVAYIIRQLKRPEEIQFLREVYGDQVFQISCYADEQQRASRLAKLMRDHDSSSTRASDFDASALSLIRTDEHEESVDNGQRMRDVFPLADVFIDATSPETISSTVERMMRILFGYNFHSPSRDEYGMYMAKSAALRSVDLSRQVGAAICNEAGEIRVLGCNEVPSPKGGSYWEDDTGDSREFQGGVDTNDEFKLRLLSDVIRNFADTGVMDKSYQSVSGEQLMENVKRDTGHDLRKRLLIMDLIEYGRMLHAEMNAITDAARKGIPLADTTLYCTTFPCHLCAKHIISSGIRRVVYIEPYPKAYTYDLYRGEIALERLPKSADPSNSNKVYFEPFIGIAPNRYRAFFEKGRRKKNGKAEKWHDGSARPILRVTSESYISDEIGYLQALISQFAEKKVLLPDGFLVKAPGEKTSDTPSAAHSTDPSPSS